MNMNPSLVNSINTYCNEEQRTVLKNIYNELQFGGGLTVFRIMESYIRCEMIFDRLNGLVGQDMIREIKLDATRYYELLKRKGKPE